MIRLIRSPDSGHHNAVFGVGIASVLEKLCRKLIDDNGELVVRIIFGYDYVNVDMIT